MSSSASVAQQHKSFVEGRNAKQKQEEALLQSRKRAWIEALKALTNWVRDFDANSGDPMLKYGTQIYFYLHSKNCACSMCAFSEHTVIVQKRVQRTPTEYVMFATDEDDKYKLVEEEKVVQNIPVPPYISVNYWDWRIRHFSAQLPDWSCSFSVFDVEKNDYIADRELARDPQILQNLLARLGNGAATDDHSFEIVRDEDRPRGHKADGITIYSTSNLVF